MNQPKTAGTGREGPGWDWEHSEATTHCAPLTYCGHYVISHWPHGFNLSYRPPKEHNPLGCFPTLEAAKLRAEQHWCDCIDRAKAALAVGGS